MGCGIGEGWGGYGGCGRGLCGGGYLGGVCGGEKRRGGVYGRLG